MEFLLVVEILREGPNKQWNKSGLTESRKFLGVVRKRKKAYTTAPEPNGPLAVNRACFPNPGGSE